MAEQEGVTVKKSENFSEWFTQVIQKAELADIRYNVKGFLVHRPWSVKIMKKMYQLMENELERNGHEPMWFPAVIPESFLKKEKEHAEFSAEVFWVTEGGSEGKKLEERLALRPTSETAFYQMFSVWIRSWRDLPLKTYQSCQVWRYEGKATRPFIRGREFYWVEAHNAFATQEEAENQVKEDMEMTENVLHKQFAIPFLFFKRPEHDKFKGAVHTFASDTIMPDGKLLQLPSTHFLGQNFSRALGIKFVDKDKKEKYVWQTCYGPCIWRIFGAMVAIHGDDKGLVIPPTVAPIEIIIVPILGLGKEKEIDKKIDSIKKLLEKNNITFKVDDRKEYTPGWKFNYWELKGVPLRLEIGPKDVEKKQVILVRRDTGEKISVKDKNVAKTVKKLLEDIQDNLTKRADKFFKERMFEADKFEKLKEILDKRAGLVRVNWCGEEKCAEDIKTKTNGGEIRGTLFGKKEVAKGDCIHCGKRAKEVVYIGKAY
jgi:prolyl-tRNA synthetase